MAKSKERLALEDAGFKYGLKLEWEGEKFKLVGYRPGRGHRMLPFIAISLSGPDKGKRVRVLRDVVAEAMEG